MAKETIEIVAKVGVDGGKSLSDLKKEFKSLQSELSGLEQGSEKYRATLQRLGAVKDEIGDLRSEIEGFAGADKKIGAFSNVIGGVASGFQAAQGAAALFGSESEDLQKTLVRVQAAMAFAEGIKGIAAMGDSFKVLGNIIKANPIMLIATILIAIGAALFALKDKISIVGKAFDFFGGIINTVIDSVKTFTDWIGISSFKADEANEKLIRNAEKAKEAITERYDAEIRAAKRAGKETEDIEISKTRNLYLQNNEQIKALRNLGSRRSDEQNKQLLELEKQNKEYYQVLLDLEDQKNDKLAEKQKQANDKAKEKAKKDKEEAKAKADKEWQDALAEAERLAEIEAERNEKQAERERKLEEERAAVRRQMQEQMYAEQIKADEEEQKRLLRLEEGYKQLELQKVEWAKQGLTLISDLNELFAGKSEAAQRKAFEIDKATKLASATISGIEGTINAYKTAQASPITAVFPAYPAIQAGLAAAFAAVNVAKIAKTKFGGTEKAEAPQGGGNLGTFSQGTGGGQAPNLTSQNTVTQLNPDGTVAGQGNRQGEPMKAYVVESESRAVTERVNKLSNQSKIG